MKVIFEVLSASLVTVLYKIISCDCLTEPCMVLAVWSCNVVINTLGKNVVFMFGEEWLNFHGCLAHAASCSLCSWPCNKHK